MTALALSDPKIIDIDPQMISEFVGYDPATGEIKSWGRMSIAGLATLSGRDDSGGLLYVHDVKAHPSTHYVDTAKPKVMKKKVCPGRVSGASIVGLPVPCVVEIEGKTYEIDDGSAELDIDVPGRYSVTVRSVPYKERVFEIEIA